MKILYSIPLQGSSNPFLKTLTDALTEEDRNLEMEFSLDAIWSDEILSFDVFHIMWPEFMVDNQHSSMDIKKRIIEIKRKGVHIVSTCHNIIAHQSTNQEKNKAILNCYELSDVIHHMGMYSYNLLKERLPLVKHELIPHHIYDRLYTYLPPKDISCKHLHLSPNLNYILCLGAFRSQAENDLIKYTVRHLPKKTCLIAPSFVFARKGKWDVMYYWRKYVNFNKKLIANIYYISDDELLYYLAVSDISLIHRPKILNSGNVPLGMFAGNVIIGPEVGNVGDILKETGNFTFQNLTEIPNLIEYALDAARNGKGCDNAKYALSNWSSSVIAKKVLNSYQTLLNKKIDLNG